MTLIIFADAPPEKDSGVLMHYQHEPFAVDGWETIDARVVIARHEDEWLAEIEAWHRDLSEEAAGLTRWWGLLPGSRLVLWPTTTPFGLKPILYARAVIFLLRCAPQRTLWVIGAPEEMREYLREWAASSESIRVQDSLSSRSDDWRRRVNSSISSAWVNLFKQIAMLMIYVAFRKRRAIKPAKVLVNSLVLNSALLEKAGDHFFGRMLDSVPDIPSNDVAWLYNDIVFDQPEARAKLRLIKRSAYFVSDTFRISDLWFALRTTIEINQSLKPLQLSLPAFQIEGIPVSAFSKSFCFHLIDRAFPFLELVYYRQFLRALEQSGAGVVIYPYEEKPLERAMLLAARECVPGAKAVGFAHAAYSKGHLYIRRGHRGEPPRPSCIAVTGEIATNSFHKMGVPLEQLTTIGSPRHHCLPSQSGYPNSALRRGILLLVGHGFELRNFAAMVEVCPSLFEKFSLLIRRYPYGWIAEQNDAESRMKAAGVHYSVDGRDLFSQIEESYIVLFESTSAAMEAVLLGKIVLQVNLSDTISSNHFCGLDTQRDIEHCGSALELKAALDRLAALTLDEYAALAVRQRNLVERLYSPVMPSALKQLFCEA